MSDLDELFSTMAGFYRQPNGNYLRLLNSRDNDDDEKDIVIDSNGKVATDLNELLITMKHSNASDLHLIAGAPPKYRVNGELREMRGYSKLLPSDIENLLKDIINEESLKIFEESGDLDFAYSRRDIGRFRVNMFKQRGSWSAIFRALSDKIPTAEELGIPSSITNLIDKRRGLILVTGPTGSGKSTTLASLIDMINTNYHKNIITLEDPIEYLHKHKRSSVIQREMGVDSKSFSSALRASLREDPDVILVGEMRDYETISTAITAAETGHLVFSTLHTIGAAATIDRIIDTYPENAKGQARSQLATVLEGVISQQLIPKADMSGRVAAFDIMLGSTAVKAQIREGKTEQITGTMQIAKSEGMKLLDEHLLELATSGVITAESALEFSVDRKFMQDKLRLKLNRTR